MLPYHNYRILELGALEIRIHALLMFIGLLIFVSFFSIWAIKMRKNRIHVFMLSLLVIVGVWVGSRLFHVLFNLDHYSIFDVFDLSQGFASFGGVVLAVFLWFLYIKFYHLNFFEWGDIAAPYLPLISLFTRIGCFLNGCCYGIPTNLPWGIRHLSEIRHPTQLYHIIAMIMMFLILLKLKNKRRFIGFLLIVYFIMYFAQRFIIDFFRYYKPEYYLYFLTIFQWISLAVIALCIFLFIKKRFFDRIN